MNNIFIVVLYMDYKDSIKPGFPMSLTVQNANHSCRVSNRFAKPHLILWLYTHLLFTITLKAYTGAETRRVSGITIANSDGRFGAALIEEGRPIGDRPGGANENPIP